MRSRLKRITKLERLANQDRLVCPFPYDNPTRDGEIFYSFCRQYGGSLGVPITEERFGYLKEKKRQIREVTEGIIGINVIEGKIGDSGLSRKGFLYQLFSLLLTPFDIFVVPIVGMTPRCESKGKQIRISFPKYPGLMDLLYSLKDKDNSLKAHEYMHVYNRTVANDLLKRNAFQSPHSFFCDVEPGYKVPTYKELRNYERQFLTEMIKSEEKWIQK